MANTNEGKIDKWPERAREVMSREGLTYDDLSESLGVATRGSVSHYFSGRRSLSAKQAVALADRLGCSVEWLLTGKTFADEQDNAAMMPEEITKLLQKTSPEVYLAVVSLVKELSKKK
ncbi:MAG: hypothetical protein CMK32_02040 [Porticoccaceae bacterium]|nr:hypothetical protein [Porticoccaceae bacterium]